MGFPLLELPDELLAEVIAPLARLRLDDAGGMFRAARSCRRIHRAALTWICYVEPSIFTSRGPGLVLVDGGRGVTQTENRTDAFGLAGPVLRSGTASATFKLVFKRHRRHFVVGVFRADHKLDSTTYSADGKRCALEAWGDRADVLWDGVSTAHSEWTNYCIDWQTGDTVDVRMWFVNATTARIVFLFKGRIEARTLEGVPECGLRFGVGLIWNYTSVTLTTSSVDAGA